MSSSLAPESLVAYPIDGLDRLKSCSEIQLPAQNKAWLVNQASSWVEPVLALCEQLSALSRQPNSAHLQPIYAQLLQLFDASGIVIVLGEHCFSFGLLTETGQVNGVLAWLRQNSVGGCFRCNGFNKAIPLAFYYPVQLGGVLAVGLDETHDLGLVWLRSPGDYQGWTEQQLLMADLLAGLKRHQLDSDAVPNQDCLVEFDTLPSRLTTPSQFQLLAAEQSFRELADAAPVLIWLSDLDKACYWFNKTWLDFTGRTMSEEVGNGWTEGVHPEDFERCLDIYIRHFEQRLPFRMEYRLRRHDGEYRWIDDSGAPRINAEGVFEGYIGSCVDITEVRNSKAANDFFNVSHEIIFSTDLSGIILDCNQRFVEVSGYSRPELIGQPIRILKSGLHDEAFYTRLWQAVCKEGYWHGEVTNRNKKGEIFSAVTTITSVRDAAGVAIRYLVIASDISAVIEKHRQLQDLAYYDSLTGLPNRLMLISRLEQAMTRVQRDGGCLAVLFLDLDGFKAINDSYGHDVADAFLVAISQEIQALLVEGDTLVRIEGDEFIVLLNQLANQRDADRQIKQILTACNQPMVLKNLHFRGSVSIGVSFYGQGFANLDLDSDSLIRHADQAMYLAKQNGKNRVHYFDDRIDALSNTRYETLNQIQEGLAANQFLLFFQPKVNMRNGELVGVEALIRWQHPFRGLLEPLDFMAVIEHHPMSVALGNWVIESALRQLGLWQRQGLDIPISINVDARQLNQHDFVELLQQRILAYPNFRPGRLQIEILETTAIYDREYATHIILACQKLGVEFALDDFGTGYSSLTHLRQLPINSIKIDRSFIKSMDQDHQDLAIVDSVIRMASHLGHEIVAEGIETLQQGEMLLAMGCDIAQGFLIAKPMPAEQIPGWLQNWQADSRWLAMAKLPKV